MRALASLLPSRQKEENSRGCYFELDGEYAGFSVICVLTEHVIYDFSVGNHWTYFCSCHFYDQCCACCYSPLWGHLKPPSAVVVYDPSATCLKYLYCCVLCLDQQGSVVSQEFFFLQMGD